MLARSKHNFSGRVITRISKCWEHGGTARSRGASYAPSRLSKPLPVTDLKTPFGCVHQANSLASLDPVARDRHVDPIRETPGRARRGTAMRLAPEMSSGR